MLREAPPEARNAVHRLTSEIELERNVELSTKILDSRFFERLRRSALPFWRSFAQDERILLPTTTSRRA